MPPISASRWVQRICYELRFVLNEVLVDHVSHDLILFHFFLETWLDFLPCLELIHVLPDLFLVLVVLVRFLQVSGGLLQIDCEGRPARPKII